MKWARWEICGINRGRKYRLTVNPELNQGQLSNIRQNGMEMYGHDPKIILNQQNDN